MIKSISWLLFAFGGNLTPAVASFACSSGRNQVNSSCYGSTAEGVGSALTDSDCELADEFDSGLTDAGEIESGLIIGFEALAVCAGSELADQFGSDLTDAVLADFCASFL